MPAPPQLPESAIPIVLVDDDPLLVALVEMAFKRLQPDWDLRVFHDPLLALEALQELPHAVVITDWMMPSMDGLEFVRQLHGLDPRNPSRFFTIVLTARQRIEDLEEALGTADDYLRKPFDPRELAARVRAGLRFVRLQSGILFLMDSLEREASTDALTGAFNRRRGVEILGAELERVRRGKQELALIMADIDHFKSINDTYGHQTGDAVLVEFTQRLRASLRPYDALVRWGGEEFLVVCPHTTSEDARRLAERLRLRIACDPFKVPEGEIDHITASFGTRVASDTENNLTILLREVDAALYEAKFGGRNQVRCADPDRTVI